jgi:hypothetical protein
MDVNELDLLHNRDRQTELLLEKWKPFLSAEADDKYGKLHGDRQKLNMAILMENQWQHQKAAFGPAIMADTATSDEALITRVALPVVRRAYAQIFQGPWSSVQPMSQPSSFVFWLDFLRDDDDDTTNTLSVEYQYAQNSEGSVPVKMKLSLVKRQINAIKQIEGVSWTQEAEEDLMAVLGLNAEDEIMNAATNELVRNLLGRHLKEIFAASGSWTSDGANLTAPWNANLAVTTIPAQGGDSVGDYKQRIYNYLINANVLYQKANRRPATGIVAGYGLAGLLQKMNTATATDIQDDNNLSSVGITNYGTYAGRFNIQATDFLPDDSGFLYSVDPNPLYSGHVYAPYVPITAMPKVYASYAQDTGAYANTDTWTRNIRERSASTVVKGYAYAQIKAASLTF